MPANSRWDLIRGLKVKPLQFATYNPQTLLFSVSYAGVPYLVPYPKNTEQLDASFKIHSLYVQLFPSV